MEKYTILVEQDEDGVLVGSAVELPGCHTQANTYDELFSRMKEAIELYREVQPCFPFASGRQNYFNPNASRRNN